MLVYSPSIICVMLPAVLRFLGDRDLALGGPIVSNNTHRANYKGAATVHRNLWARWLCHNTRAPLRGAADGRTLCVATPNLPTQVNLTLIADWEAPSSATTLTVPTIKEQRPSTATCGLGGCATTRLHNPFVLAMQVGNHRTLFTKKNTTNYFLVQLPSPQCCLATCIECFHVVRPLLLMCGDIESNPGPDKLDVILGEPKKMSTGQTELVKEVQELKFQLLSMDQKMTNLTTRLSALEIHCGSLSTLRSDLEGIQATSAATSRLVGVLEARLDDAENRSRRNNLLFYGLPDTNPTETYSLTEDLVIRHCSDHLDTQLSPNDIERAHRLGRHSKDRKRPIIVKFTFFKTKESILSKGSKFKGTDYSVGEDFSRRVQNCRKHLVAFARAKSVPFSLRFKTLHIRPERYVFDELSESVKEIS
ncbi:uncharacterized protein [Dermacentor andersoni]|uniref:uncharacterized protein n=1 Tax=Dermacentor andersoni TaxID=34620 RepID=UPI003B3BE93A